MLSLIPVKAQTLENLECISTRKVPVILFVCFGGDGTQGLVHGWQALLSLNYTTSHCIL